MADRPNSLQASAIVLGSRTIAVPELAAHLAAVAPRGLTMKRSADIDEDTTTLAVAAIRRLLARTKTPAAAIGQLFLVGVDGADADTTVTTALARPDVPVSRFLSTPEAAVDALLAAFGSDPAGPTILVAVSDGRDGDPVSAGAAAVALLIGPGSGIRLIREAHRRVPRTEELGEATGEVVAELGSGVEHVVVAERILGEARPFRSALAGRTVTTAPIDRAGDLGAAAPFVALLAGLRTVEEGERFDWLVPSRHAVIGARFEAKETGSCEDLDAALHGAATATDPGTALRVRDAWRLHGDQVAQGAFVSLQQYLHEAPARYRLEGQRCTACGRVLFPPREGCPDHPDARLVVEPLSGRGTVYARTTIARGGAPTEFAPQQEATGTYAVAVVELEEGPRVAAQLTGPGAEQLDIGAPVLAVFRLLYVQAGVPRYGFKFTGAMD